MQAHAYGLGDEQTHLTVYLMARPRLDAWFVGLDKNISLENG